MFSRDLTTKTTESNSGFLVAGLRAAWSAQSSIVDGNDAMTRLVELEKASRFIEAARAEVLAEVDRTGAFRDHGHTTMAGWLRAGISYSAGDAKHHVKVARMVVEFPQISERLRSGRNNWCRPSPSFGCCSREQTSLSRVACFCGHVG
jgi:hypothetical protein